jgi:hypothetical protein
LNSEKVRLGNIGPDDAGLGGSPSIKYGTASKLAVVDKKVTKRVPASIRLPRVGQPLAGKEAD